MRNKLFYLLLLGLALARDPFTPPAAEALPYRAVSLNYLSAETAAETVQKLCPDAVIAVEETGNYLLLGLTGQTNRALKILQDIDQPPRAVQLNIQILELTANDLNQLGVDWNFTSAGARFGKTTPEIEATLRALAGAGKTKMLAAPNLVTLTGKPALIQIGDRLPYALPVQTNNSSAQWQIQYIDSGINLAFLALPAADDQIYLEVQPEISSIKYWKQTPGGEFPVLSTRKVKTNLLLKNGESFILAGLYNEEERESVQKVPFLGDLPLLNIFFKNTVKETLASDIIFVVTAAKTRH
ncbi:MAG: type II and III secretion system protein [Candidatus Margulisbacteria bacterium]|jgi:type II secretory pathway component GspD/PulD (secretin)|nr:type II and III secretion system protein [Candidatus Margulisiibacteriota bacterium]